MNQPDTRICNSRSTSKRQKVKGNFSALPLLCQKKNAPQIERIHVRQIELAPLRLGARRGLSDSSLHSEFQVLLARLLFGSPVRARMDFKALEAFTSTWHFASPGTVTRNRNDSTAA